MIARRSTDSMAARSSGEGSTFPTQQVLSEDNTMRMSHLFRASLRASLIAFVALAGSSVSSAAYADSGSISFRVLKAGWVVGGSGGSGTLGLHRQSYPRTIL